MALAWIDDDVDESDDEDLHGRFLPACAMLGWDLSRTRGDDRHLQWAHTAQAQTRQLDSEVRLRSLLNELRHTLTALSADALRGWSHLDLSMGEEQLLRAALEVTAVVETEPTSEHDLIDWQEANRAQWENGLRATLGADGERLVQIRILEAPQTATEADDDEVLDD